jgi:hypothetical protein
MEEKFQVSMSRTVLVIFFLTLSMVAAAVAWSFKSGFTWTAICLIAVAGPLGLFYWYMLHVNTQRASIVLYEDGIQVTAPPFLEATFPYSEIQNGFMADIKAEKQFHSKDDKRIMRFGGYVSGIYTLQNGSEAIVLTNKSRVVCLMSEATCILLGPDDIQRLIVNLQSRGIAISGT